MPSLLQCLRRPHTWLGVLLLLATLSLVDACRAPGAQLTARWYIVGIHLYQRFGRPLIGDRVRCRYRPSCSEYSIRAVRQYGIKTGLVTTLRRVRSCTLNVEMGTYDPVR